MKQILILIVALSAWGSAAAAKPCEELKSEIAAKIDAKGVKAYTLEIVASDKVGDLNRPGFSGGSNL
jgi:hypothetical protein